MPDALISIKPKFVDKMINGQKTVEIRTRKVQLEKNSKLWIYTTLPKASVQMLTHIKYIEFGHPKTIWSIVPDFQPPQFIKLMHKSDPILLAILKILSEKQK